MLWAKVLSAWWKPRGSLLHSVLDTLWGSANVVLLQTLNSQVAFNFEPARGNVVPLRYDLCCWQIHQTHKAARQMSGLENPCSTHGFPTISNVYLRRALRTCLTAWNFCSFSIEQLGFLLLLEEKHSNSRLPEKPWNDTGAKTLTVLPTNSYMSMFMSHICSWRFVRFCLTAA